MIRINVSHSPSATLPAVYGFPVKLLMPTRLGFKNPRHIVAMEVTNTYPGGFREDYGYNLFSGISAIAMSRPRRH
jgi:DMSO/TMAO reductase YedYZ molybdopterin-dependent catalytic subunit